MKAPPKNLVVNLGPAIRHIEHLTSSLLQDRIGLGNLLDAGNSTDGTRNLNEECKYPDPVTLDHLYEMYGRELGNRVVSVESEATWETEPELRENEEPRNTPFEDKWEELAFRVGLFHYLERVDRLSGIGRFGVLYIAFNDGNDPKTPVPGIDRNGRQDKRTLDPDLDVSFLRAFDERLVRVVMTEQNKKSPRHGLPTQYEILFSGDGRDDLVGGVSSEVGGEWTRVHWSRILHVADNRDASEIFGVPRQKAVYNRLHDLRKILGGSGEMFYRGAFPGISFEMLPELVAEGEIDNESLQEQVEQYVQGLRRYLSLRGFTAKSLAPQVADPSKHVEEQLRVLCAILRVPMRVFLGAEAGQLASEQDAKAWNKRIGKRKRTYVEPKIVRPFITLLQTVGVLPAVKAYRLVWSDPETVSDKDQADIVMKKATALLQYVSSGAETVFPAREFLMLVFGLSVDQTEMVMRAVEKNKKKYLTPGAKAPQEPKPGTGAKDPANKTGGGARNGMSGKRTARKAAGAK